MNSTLQCPRRSRLVTICRGLFLCAIIVRPTVLSATWVSPTSHTIESELHWNYCQRAYDDNINTAVSQKSQSSREPLELIFDIPVANVDYYHVSFTGNHDQYLFEIWSYYSDQWHIIWDGSEFEPPLSMAATSIGAVERIRLISEDPLHNFFITEFKVHQVPELASLLLLVSGSLLFSSSNIKRSHSRGRLLRPARQS